MSKRSSETSSSRLASTTTQSTIAAARHAQYVAFLHRHPFATDAYDLGFTTGVREDYTLQTDGLANVNVPVVMLDNNFNNPDLERYLDSFRHYTPEIAVIGDAYSRADAHRFNAIADDLRAEYPDVELIVVPKCRDALNVLNEDLVLGYALGYSNVHATDFSDPADWRGRRIHLLGASPPKQWQAIQDLTQPTLGGDPPADIVGLDWNGPQKIAYLGEYWSRDGWQSADHLSIRATVRKSLREIRAFWRERGVWPATTPVEQRGPAVREPDDSIFASNGRSINHQDDLEDAIVVEYEIGQTLAYESQARRDFVEYRSGLVPVSEC